MACMSFDAIRQVIESRTNTSARRLLAPGPDSEQLAALLSLAAAAPDHGRLTPWRFILVPQHARERLAHVFMEALRERDPCATREELERAREKAFNAPTLVLCIARLRDQEDSKVGPLERMVSFGAAIQNVLLGAHAMGFQAGLTSGQAMSSLVLRELLQMSEGEHAVCCINIGTAHHRAKEREPRSGWTTYSSELAPESPAAVGVPRDEPHEAR